MNKCLMLALGLLVFPACGADTAAPVTEETPSFLGAGDKSDNFFSESAQEYYVRGTTTLTLEAEYADATEEERMKRVAELIPYKQVVIGYFLNTYLIDKSDHDSNADYGGFKALTKNGSYEDLDIVKVDDLNYTFRFVQEIGGQNDLLSELSRNADGASQEDGSIRFNLAIGKVSNADMARLDYEAEWYRSSPWSDFSPTTAGADRVEYQELEVLPQPRSNDAWLDYNRLFADGKLEIGTFFGWDYHSDYHRKHAEATYNWLLSQGFKSPTDSWAKYATNRAPLTYKMEANGKPVEVAITLWWGEPGTITDADTAAGGRKLEEEMRASFKKNEVTMFSGHSGPFYGFALATWRKTPEGDLDDSEIAGLDMPSDVYQVVLAEGCDTYALGQAFWANPAKAGRKNLDIVTTTSFSNASTSKIVTDFLGALVGTTNGKHKPVRYGQLLKTMDSGSSWFSTMYGVHGIDDNPQGHPYANVDALCGSCDTNADCGGEGNRCVELEGERKCTYECTSDAGCPESYTCRKTSTNGWLSASYCMPASFSCDDIPAPTGPTLAISEVLADPADGLEGDANGDGTRSATQDEFVEIHNLTNEAIELEGFSLSDNVMSRFTFPLGARIEANSYVVVFGGGDAADFTGLPEVGVYSAKGLALNNTGDTVTLSNRRAEVMATFAYGREGGQNQSMVMNGETVKTATLSTPGAAN